MSSLELGLDLNAYRRLKFITGKTADELELLLTRLPVMYRLINVYHDGQNHVACILPERKINDLIIRRIKNGKPG